MKIRKDFSFKIIAFTISTSFLFTTSLYSYPDELSDNRHTLRVPSGFVNRAQGETLDDVETGFPDRMIALMEAQAGSEEAADKAFDRRPVAAGLLQEAYVRHDMTVKEAINPDNEDKITVYGGAAADVANFLLSTNSTKGYFVDFYGRLLPTDLERLKDYKDRAEQRYSEDKFRLGWSYGLTRWFDGFLEIDKEKLLAVLALELEAMGVDLDSVEAYYDEERLPTIRFRWAYQNTPEETYTITFVNADITQPDQSEALMRVLARGIDVYYQRAGISIPESYSPESFIGTIYKHMNPGGFFVTDDYGRTFREDGQRRVTYFKDFGPMFSDLPLREIRTAKMRSIEDEIIAQKAKEKYKVKEPTLWIYRSDPDLNYGWRVRIRQNAGILTQSRAVEVVGEGFSAARPPATPSTTATSRIGPRPARGSPVTVDLDIEAIAMEIFDFDEAGRPTTLKLLDREILRDKMRQIADLIAETEDMLFNMELASYMADRILEFAEGSHDTELAEESRDLHGKTAAYVAHNVFREKAGSLEDQDEIYNLLEKEVSRIELRIAERKDGYRRLLGGQTIITLQASDKVISKSLGDIYVVYDPYLDKVFSGFPGTERYGLNVSRARRPSEELVSALEEKARSTIRNFVALHSIAETQQEEISRKLDELLENSRTKDSKIDPRLAYLEVKKALWRDLGSIGYPEYEGLDLKLRVIAVKHGDAIATLVREKLLEMELMLSIAHFEMMLRDEAHGLMHTLSVVDRSLDQIGQLKKMGNELQTPDECERLAEVVEKAFSEGRDKAHKTQTRLVGLLNQTASYRRSELEERFQELREGYAREGYKSLFEAPEGIATAADCNRLVKDCKRLEEDIKAVFPVEDFKDIRDVLIGGYLIKFQTAIKYYGMELDKDRSRADRLDRLRRGVEIWRDRLLDVMGPDGLFEHTKREFIKAVEEEVNLEIVIAGALLHDVEALIVRRNHDREGAKFAAGMLDMLEYDIDFCADVSHCVEAHRGVGIYPETAEACIIQAADTFEGLDMERIWLMRLIYPRPDITYLYTPTAMMGVVKGELAEMGTELPSFPGFKFHAEKIFFEVEMPVLALLIDDVDGFRQRMINSYLALIRRDAPETVHKIEAALQNLSKAFRLDMWSRRGPVNLNQLAHRFSQGVYRGGYSQEVAGIIGQKGWSFFEHAIAYPQAAYKLHGITEQERRAFINGMNTMREKFADPKKQMIIDSAESGWVGDDGRSKLFFRLGAAYVLDATIFREDCEIFMHKKDITYAEILHELDKIGDSHAREYLFLVQTWGEHEQAWRYILAKLWLQQYLMVKEARTAEFVYAKIDELNNELELKDLAKERLVEEYRRWTAVEPGPSSTVPSTGVAGGEKYLGKALQDYKEAVWTDTRRRL